MPPLNVRTRQPAAAFWYMAFAPLSLSALLLVFGIFAIAAAPAETGAFLGLLGTLLLLAVGLVVGYAILYYLLFTYELSEHTLTVNIGVLFRQYETMDFNKVQTIDNERGPLLMLFGLTIVKVWTASADQLSSSSEGLGIHATPDMRLILGKDDAKALKDFILRKQERITARV